MSRYAFANNYCKVCRGWKENCRAVCVVISTYGRRAERKQANSGTVTLCPDCTKKLLGGRIPAALRDGLKAAHAKLGAA